MKIVETTGWDFDRVDKELALLPVGSVERHGDHLPLGTDGIIPEHIAERAASKLKCILLPTVWYGSCKAMRDFPGTFDVDSETLSRYVLSIMAEAHRNGVKLLCIVNGHGGNSTPLSMAAREVSSKTELSVIVLDWWKELGIDAIKTFESPGHAGEDETSAALAICGEKVRMDRAASHEVVYPSFRFYSRSSDRKLYSIALTGDARKASKEKGEVLLKAVEEDLVRVIGEAMKILQD